MMYLKVLFGFILLLGAAEFMVRGSVTLAKQMGVPPLVIGMTVVAIGTSAPELVVGLQAALSGAPGMALGNVVGSNIANVLLILGAAGIIAPVIAKEGALLRDSVVLMGGSLLFAFFCMRGSIGLIPGVILVAGLAGFLVSSYWRQSRDSDPDAELLLEEVEEVGELPRKWWIVWGAVLGGLAGILLGSDLLVDGGVNVARTFGVPEEVIGLTLVALGTSLPELAASGVAAFRGHSDVAIGNVVGSNLFNILGIAGVVAIVVPLPVSAQIIGFDIWVMLITTALVLPLMILRWRLTRPAAGVFLAAYGGYIFVQGYGVEKALALF